MAGTRVTNDSMSEQRLDSIRIGRDRNGKRKYLQTRLTGDELAGSGPVSPSPAPTEGSGHNVSSSRASVLAEGWPD